MKPTGLSKQDGWARREGTLPQLWAQTPRNVKQKNKPKIHYRITNSTMLVESSTHSHSVLARRGEDTGHGISGGISGATWPWLSCLWNDWRNTQKSPGTALVNHLWLPNAFDDNKDLTQNLQPILQALSAQGSIHHHKVQLPNHWRSCKESLQSSPRNIPDKTADKWSVKADSAEQGSILLKNAAFGASL